MNRIPKRISEALGNFPPFSLLAPEVVERLGEKAAVQVWVKNDTIWQQGTIPEGELLFLAKGRVEYHWNREGHSELVDVRDVGDVLGLTALVEGVPYQVSAIATDDCLIFSLPYKDFSEEIERNDEARNYITRHLFWVTRLGGAVSSTAVKDITTPAGMSGRAKGILGAHLHSAQVISVSGNQPVSCRPEAPVAQAAELLSNHNLDAIVIVDGEQRPLGYIAATDLVSEIIVKGRPQEMPVSEIMHGPAVCIPDYSSAIAAVLLMMQKRVSLLCVTEDGSPTKPLLDVWTDRALMKMSGYHPAGLMRDLGRTTTISRARQLSDEVENLAGQYLRSGVSSVVVGQICAELYDELVDRLIQLAMEELAEKGQHFDDFNWAWISVGSDGRREQILRTDMDNALIFADGDTPEETESRRQRLLVLSNRVVAMLVECGISRCQGGVMASNPKWCRSEEEWLQELRLTEWNPSPENILRAIVLYDMRFVSGDESLVTPIRESIFQRIPKCFGVMHRLAELTVSSQPPLNFSAKHVIEKKGRKRRDFDLKKRAITPLRDAARLWVLRHGLSKHYSTGSRFTDLQANVPKIAELCQLSRQSYEDLMRLRVLNGLDNNDSGRFINPATLSKLERARLSNVFDVIRMVQAEVRSQFGLEARLK
ncbi:MAG: DUF294 nucleotidyltransferase-like domain-containing protein [Verrucomicrobiota bacterium JB023]|nr:DUF294 nucleotidyltransferase-like domain-containing protein [Verrucomicrobiota bacterium JB023]